MSIKGTSKDKKNVIETIFRFSPVIGAVIGLLAAALFVMLYNVDPITFIGALCKGALGSAKAIGNSLNRATPYIIVGAENTIAFKCGSMNMGQEGQVFMGGLGVAVVALILPSGTPALIAIPLALIGGMIMGAIFISLPIFLRVKRGVNEVVVTLIMNYMATLIVSALVVGPLGKVGASYPCTENFGEQYSLFNWKSVGHLHVGIFIAIAVAILAIYMFWVNPIGLKARAAGSSPAASLTAGINPTKVFIIGMLVNGAFCGLAGGVELLGRYNNLRGGYADGIGWDSLIVALLSGMNPKGVIPAGIFFGALFTGVSSLQRSIGVPSALLSLIKGIIIVCVVTGTAIEKYHLNRWLTKKKTVK